MEEQEEVGPLKEFYYSIEDKWYDFLDSVNRVVPIEGVIRKIDSVIPSLILFIIILVLLIGAGLWVFLSFMQVPPTTFKVVDENNVILSGVKVTVRDGANVGEYSSDGFGEFQTTLTSQKVKIEITHEGFEPFSQEMTVVEGENVIVLNSAAPVFEKKLVTIVDEKNEVLEQESIVSFSCSASGPAPGQITVQSGAEFEVSFLEECGILTATVESQGFLSATKVLSSLRTTIKLQPQEIPTGQLVVQVRDSSTRSLLPNIDLKLFKAKIFPTKVNEGRTDVSGSYTFNVKPGKYFVTASDRVTEIYNSNDSEEFEINANETKTIEILLEINESEKNKLFFKFVDSDSELPIESVKADLFENDLFFASAPSDGDGLVPFRNLDENKDYAVVLTHPEYVTMVLDSLELIEAQNTEPLEVKLVKANSGNSGAIRVKVSSVEQEGNVGIELADVFLYNTTHDFPLLSGKTNSSGEFLFENLPGGSYFAKAETPTHSGESGIVELVFGGEILLSIEFVTKKSHLIVKTVNESGNPIAGVNVKFFDATTDDLLEETGTGTDGETDRISFEWTKKVYIVASEPNYLPYRTKIFYLIPENNLKTQIVMQSVSANPDFTIRLAEVMDSTAEKRAKKFDRGKTYYLKFNLIVPQDGLTEIESVVRTGFEENLNVGDNNFFIMGILKGSLQTQSIFSSCYDPQDDFAACTVTDANAKQVNLAFGSLDKGVYEFLVKVFVAPEIEPRAKLQLRFGAKAMQDSVPLRKPQTGLFFKEFILGDPIFCVRGTAKCPNFGFFFTLSDPTGIHLTEPLEIDSRSTVELIQDIEYGLDYVIWNWDGSGESFSNISLTLTDELETGAVEFSPSRVELGLFEVDTSIAGPPFTLEGINQASAVQLKATLGAQRPDNSTTLRFKVLAKNDLEIEVFPQELSENAVNFLTVKVTDAKTNDGVDSAIVKVARDSEFSDIIATKDVSAGGGIFVLQLPPMSAEQTIFVMAEGFNYNPSEVVEVTVTASLSFTPTTEADFECIKVLDTQLTLTRLEKRNFKIETQNCPTPVEFYLYQPFAGEPLTLENLKTVSIISNSITPSFVLSENDSISVRVNADKFLGEYGIIVRAKFDKEQEFRDVERIRIEVLPKSVEDGYCFEMDKTSFSLEPTDAGKITNRCGIGVVDPFLPYLFLDSSSATLNKEHLQLFPEIRFRWSTELLGTLNPSGEQTREVTSRLDAPTSSITINLFELVMRSFTEAMALGCAIVSMQGGDCMKYFKKHPEQLMLLVFIMASKNFAVELGEVETYTCEQCEFSALGEIQPLVLGTTIKKVHIKDIVFDDGGWITINDHPIQIPSMGPPPQTLQEEQSEENGQAGLSIVSSTALNPTGLTLLQMGGGLGSIEGLLGSLGGLGGSLGGMGGGLGNLSGLLGGFTELLGLLGALNEADSCTGHLIEASNCAGLDESQGFLGQVFSFALIPSYCTQVGTPIDVTDKVREGSNEYQLFVCNKYNEGFVEVTFEIEDLVEVRSEQEASLNPIRGEIADLGVLSDLTEFYLDNAFVNSALHLNISNNSGGQVASWVEESGGVKGLMVEEFEGASKETAFEIKNISLEGEEYALLTVEDYVSLVRPAELDIVYLVDTSPSMTTERAVFCEKKNLIEAELSSQQISVVSKVYAISEENEQLSCADGVAGWGDSEINKEEVEHAADESWGPALQDALQKHPWREKAKKVAVIVSDAGPLGSLKDFEISEQVIVEASNGEGEEEPEQENGEEDQESGSMALEHAVSSAVNKGVVVSALFGIPFEREGQIEELRAIVDQTGGFMKSFETSLGSEKFFANQLLKSVFETQTETFHIRLEGKEVGVCKGANDQLGVTGASVLPRVKLQWDWESIGVDTCSLGNEEYVYCDATHLTKQIIKRLVKVREKTLAKDYEVGDLLTFKAFLIKDSYSSSFTSAFDKYVNEKEFLPLEEYVTNWSKFVSDSSKFAFKSDYHSVEPIPATGLYQINIVPNFPEGKEWQFFEEDQSIGSIDVLLTLEEEIAQTNPFYFLPFNSGLGLNETNDALTRDGFGVSFKGSVIKLTEQSSQTEEVSTHPATGSGVVSLDVEFENNFSNLNKGLDRGVLLSVGKRADGYSMAFSPSIATPIVLEIVGKDNQALGFFEIREGNSIVPADGFYSAWSGIASTIGSCNDFDGQPLPFKQPDSPASGVSCRLNGDAILESSHGFSWSEALDGRVFLRTVFYTPNTNYKIRNSCVTDSLIISPVASSSQEFLNLDFGSDKEVLSIKDLFQLVEDERVCVGESNGSVDFWWNESFLFEELQKNYAGYFERISQEEENFAVCVTG